MTASPAATEPPKIGMDWTLPRRYEESDAAQERATRDYRDLAAALLLGFLGLDAWLKRFQAATARNLAAQLALGKRGPLTEEDTARLAKLTAREDAYAERFAGDIAKGHVNGKPLSVGYVRTRSNLYTGAARGQFYRGIEQSIKKALESGDRDFGLPAGPRRGVKEWVVDYVPLDDDNTCKPCHRAGQQGPYRVGEGPLPGEVCLGKGLCRCRRVLRHDPFAWAKIVAGETQWLNG